MKTFFSFISIFFLLTVNAIGQISITDSLEKELLHSPASTNKVDLLNELANNYRHGDPEKGIQKARIAKELAIKLNYQKGIGVALERMGNLYRVKREFSVAHAMHLEALRIFSKISNTLGIAECYMDIATWFSAQNQKDSVLTYLAKSRQTVYALMSSRDSLTAFKAKQQFLLTYHHAFAFFFLRADYQEALNIIKKAEQMFIQLNQKVMFPNMCNNFGVTYRALGDYDKALKYLFKGVKIGEELKDWEATQRLYGNITETYTLKSDYDKAIKYSKKTIQLLQDYVNFDKPAIGYSYIQLASIYNAKGDYQGAITNYMAALKIFENGSPFDLSVLLSELSNFYLVQKDYLHAAKYANDLLKVSKITGGKGEISDAYFQLAQIASTQNQLDTALNYHLKSLSLKEELGQKSKLANGYLETGNVLFKIAQTNPESKNIYLDSSYNCIKQAVFIGTEVSDDKTLASAYISLGLIEKERNKLNDAFAHFSEAALLAETIGAKPELFQAYKELAEIAQLKKNYKDAFRYYKLYAEIKDSVFNETSSKQIKEAEAKYETEKKDAQITLLNKDSEIKNLDIKKQQVLRNSLIAGILLVMLIGVLLFNRYRLQQVHKQIAERMSISSDLHDEVGSTLSSIGIYSAYANQKLTEQNHLEAKSILEEISISSQQMSDDMNDIVWAINPTNDNLAHIVDRLQNYASRMTQSKNILLQFSDNDSLKNISLTMDQRKNLYLICKEAVNNAVKYSACKNLHVNILLNKNILHASIEDDGKGFDIQNSFEGNGLKNMQYRAEQIKANFSINSESDKGTRVVVEIKIA